MFAVCLVQPILYMKNVKNFVIGRNRVVKYLLKKVPKQQTITNLVDSEVPNTIGMYENTFISLLEFLP